MKTIELRPDRSLLKPNFDGYKLSLEPIPILRTELTPTSSQPNRIRPSEAQYSHLHAQMFGLQNFLVRDPWAPGSCYFVNRELTVCWIQYNEISGRLMPLAQVFKIDAEEEGDETYNCSVVFVSEKYALVADGRKGLHLVDTGDRRRGGEWHKKFSFGSPEWPGSCVLEDGRFEIVNGERQIHAIGAYVVQEDGTFKTVLHWVKIAQKDSNEPWEFHSSRVLKGRGYAYYCALEPKSNGLVVASDKPFRFATNEDEEPVDVPMAEGDEAVVPEEPRFSWTQTTENITITVPKVEGVEYKISNENLKLSVLSGTTSIVNAEGWFAGVDGDLTSWINESAEIQITLFKTTPGLWPFLYPGCPEEKSDRMDQDMAPVSNLTSQLEECDFGETGDETEYTIERLDGTSMETTHRVFLGGNAPLFRVMLRPGFPDALALRYDVDACLWLQHPGTAEWSLRHEGTLHAFGYVQASKQQRKFMACSPDLNYALICEAQRHVFIYKGNYNTAGGLRNRNGPQVSIGQQKLVALEGSSEILGICCENDYTILLLESEILVLQLRIEE